MEGVYILRFFFYVQLGITAILWKGKHCFSTSKIWIIPMVNRYFFFSICSRTTSKERLKVLWDKRGLYLSVRNWMPPCHVMSIKCDNWTVMTIAKCDLFGLYFFYMLQHNRNISFSRVKKPRNSLTFQKHPDKKRCVCNKLLICRRNSSRKTILLKQNGSKRLQHHEWVRVWNATIAEDIQEYRLIVDIGFSTSNI